MKKRATSSGWGAWLCLGFLILFIVSSRTRSTVFVLLAILVAGWLGVVAIRVFLERGKLRALQIANIDNMTGVQFEQYLRNVLASRGFRVTTTPVTGDLGVDLIAIRANDRIAIQVKRHEGGVSRQAVSDAVAGMKPYKCNRAMVITNSYFTAGAKSLAASNDCSLVGRDVLTEWILEFQGERSLKDLSASKTVWFVTCLIIVVALGYCVHQKPKSSLSERTRKETASLSASATPLAAVSPEQTPILTPAVETRRAVLANTAPREQRLAQIGISVQPPNSSTAAWRDGRTLMHPEHSANTHLVNLSRNETLKLRTGPGTKFKAAGEIPADATEILAFDQDQIWDGDTWWCPVQWHGLRGYVNRNYLPR